MSNPCPECCRLLLYSFEETFQRRFNKDLMVVPNVYNIHIVYLNNPKKTIISLKTNLSKQILLLFDKMKKKKKKNTTLSEQFHNLMKNLGIMKN